MTARYVNERTGRPETPAPDDWCRNCRGSRRASDGTACEDCNGTGWRGLMYATHKTLTLEGTDHEPCRHDHPRR